MEKNKETANCPLAEGMGLFETEKGFWPIAKNVCSNKKNTAMMENPVAIFLFIS
jgi:hypothetical protein